ncbi:MAG: ROK family protein, partial [Candidatus Izimaplasma sp.]|nr:ROK family protein [Candidatus Izimaplasma bacterium]
NDNIYIGNDANIATLGESLHGVAKGYQKIAMITIGTGIGGGFVVDSKIIDGAHGAAGEIGHIKVVHENQIQCNCGNYGCLETVASATGIKREFKRLVETTKLPSTLRGKKLVSVKMIFDAAKKGDLLCRKIVDRTAYYIGYTCHVISLTTNPEIIIIGGGVSNAGNFFIDLIQKYFNQFLFLPVENTIITKATLGNDAGIYGAASLVKND